MKEPYAGSPLEGLEELPAGAVALVLGLPRVGKTTFLAHGALSSLMRDRAVLHVSAQESVHHVRAHYDELLRELNERTSESSPGALALQVERHRMLHTTRGAPLEVGRLQAHLRLLADAAEFEPELLIVDGLGSQASTLRALVDLVSGTGQRCWASVESNAPLPAEWFDLASMVVRLVLEADAEDAPAVRVQRVHGAGDPQALPILLDAASLFALEGAPATAAGPSDQSDAIVPGMCTLYTGGAAGSEVAFGETAAAYGVQEVAFTFEGHLQQRTVGRQELTPGELAMGDVSLTYVSRRLNRSYRDSGGLIRGVLQTLWHMVNRAHQVFVIGAILPDGTVKGGTGWGVELARMWNRDLWVFDQPKARWCRWERGTWVPGQPRITAAHICGTGTRKLSPEGRAAVEALFKASFP